MPTSSHGEYKVSFALRDAFNVPNLITLSRLPFVPLIIYCLSQRDSRVYQMASLGLMAICFFTDWLDGYLARRLNKVSTLGKAIDPIVDKIIIIAFIIALVAYRDFPLWATFIFAGKEFILMLLGLTAIKQTQTAVAANIWGKINMWMLAIMSGLYVINASFKIVFLIAGLVTSVIAFFIYGIIFIRIIRAKAKGQGG